MDEAHFKSLRVKAKAKIDAQIEPAAPPTGVQGKRITNSQRCSICGEFIARQCFQYEVSVPGPGQGPIDYKMHFLCHAAWQLELEENLTRKGRIDPI